MYRSSAGKREKKHSESDSTSFQRYQFSVIIVVWVSLFPTELQLYYYSYHSWCEQPFSQCFVHCTQFMTHFSNPVQSHCSNRKASDFRTLWMICKTCFSFYCSHYRQLNGFETNLNWIHSEMLNWLITSSAVTWWICSFTLGVNTPLVRVSFCFFTSSFGLKRDILPYDWLVIYDFWVQFSISNSH